MDTVALITDMNQVLGTTAGNALEVKEAVDYLTGARRDPLGRCASPLKVIRGGSWAFSEANARCALRYTHRPVDVGYSLGFRVIRDTHR